MVRSYVAMPDLIDVWQGDPISIQWYIQGSQPTGRSGESGKTEICHPDRERAGNSVQITVIREIARISVGLGYWIQNLLNFVLSGKVLSVLVLVNVFCLPQKKLSICWPLHCVLRNAETDWLIPGHSISDDQ